MTDKTEHNKSQILAAIIGTGVAIIGVVISVAIGVASLQNNWLNTSIGEVRADIRELRTGLSADIRQVRDTARSNSDKNREGLTSHLSAHAAPKASAAK